MKTGLYVFLFFCLPATAQAQSYTDSIKLFREHYIKDLLAEKRRPVKPSEAKDISFFPANHAYCVSADFTAMPGGTSFLMPTHSGKQKPFREYGILTFSIHDTSLTLHIYQSIDLLNDAAHQDYLFIPFNDLTNYEATYGGGRYIDLSVSNIKDNKVLLDFNKAYNPYCAYADGFSCPIPPSENSLQIEIRAGERVFVR